MPELDLTTNLCKRERLVRAAFDFFAILNLRLLNQNLVDAPHRRGAPLENIDDPAQGDDWPCQLDHVCIEGDKLADADAVGNHFASAQPQYQHNGEAKHSFKRGPQHAHQTNQFQAALYVLLVGSFESGDFCFFLHISSNHAHSRKILLSARGNIRKHRLDSLEALMNLAPEILNRDADNR